MTDRNPPAPTSPSVMHMAMPLVISFWMRAAVTFVDTIYAALIGDAAVAAIGVVIPVEFVMIAVWVGLSTGLTSALSRAMGQREGRKIAQYVRATWHMIWIVAPLFTVIGAGLWFIAPHLGLSVSVVRELQIYGTVLVVGSAFTTFWSIVPDSLVKAHQDTRSTMWAGILTNLINVALNTLFIFVFHWGVFGIALSTVLGRIGGLAYALARARAHEARRIRQETTPGVKTDPHPRRAILNLAIPSSLTFMLMALETAVVNGLLARLEHATEAIAAYSIYYRVVLFALQPVIAGAVALLPFSAMRVGAGDWAGVRRGLSDTALAALLYAALVVGPLAWWGSPWLARQLAESALTATYATFALRTVPLACLTGSLFLLCRPIFEAMNRGRPGLVMAVLRYGVLMLPLSWLGMHLADSMGQPRLYGLVVGLLVASALASTIFYAWLRGTLTRRVVEAAEVSSASFSTGV